MPCYELIYSDICGADGSRTRVQTRNKYAFYMLIRLLILVLWPANGSLSEPWASNFSLRLRGYIVTIPISRAPPHR